MMERVVDQRCIKALKAHKGRISRQQYSTLRGQILAGDGEAAMKGLTRLLSRGERGK